MQVQVKVYGMLRDKLPPGAKGLITLEMPQGSSVKDVLSKLDIQMMVKASVNEELERNLERVLSDGDEVQLFRPVGGGGR